VYKTKVLFPDVIDFIASSPNAGGMNVMSYDLSDDPTFHECPPTGGCTLSDQVAFYLDTYEQAGIPAGVGYEIGQPAYPSIIVDAEHQLPLVPTELAKIVSTTQPKHKAGFFWELYKKMPTTGNDASVIEVAQAVCKSVLGASNPRCSGTFPPVGVPTPSFPTPGFPTPGPAPGPAPATTYKCEIGQCVAKTGGVSKTLCEDNCVAPATLYTCSNNMCVVAKTGGSNKTLCEQLCG
jgi:hypothetical protein